MCDSFVAMGSATADGSLVFGKNSDRPAAEKDQLSCIIRGEPFPDIDLAKPVRRLKHEKKGEGPFFRSSERGEPWVCIDFDGIACPSDLDAEADPEAAIRFLIGLLPDEFRGVSYWWQWSSSAGIKGWESLRAHLWFWLDRPVPDDELREWAKAIEAQIDPALLNAVQPHFTAAPILEGLPDPVPQRSGLLLGDECVVHLRLVAKPNLPPAMAGTDPKRPFAMLADDRPLCSHWPFEKIHVAPYG